MWDKILDILFDFFLLPTIVTENSRYKLIKILGALLNLFWLPFTIALTLPLSIGVLFIKLIEES